MYDYAAMFVFLSVLLLFLALLSVAVYVWSSFALMGLYKKVGHPHRWAAWVPFYRDFVFLEVGGQAGWWIFLGIAASGTSTLGADQFGPRWFIGNVIGFALTAAWVVFWVLAVVNINKSLGKHPVGFTIFAVLLPLIWLSVIAWDRSTADVSRANGPFIPGRGSTFLERAKAGVSSEPSPTPASDSYN